MLPKAQAVPVLDFEAEQVSPVGVRQVRECCADPAIHDCLASWNSTFSSITGPLVSLDEEKSAATRMAGALGHRPQKKIDGSPSMTRATSPPCGDPRERRFVS